MVRCDAWQQPRIIGSWPSVAMDAMATDGQRSSKETSSSNLSYKMPQRRQAMLQIRLSDQQIVLPTKVPYIRGLRVDR